MLRTRYWGAHFVVEPPDTTAALHADALTVPRAAETLDAAVEPRNDDDDRARIVPGTRLDRYYVTGLLGRGGMGEVYRGYDPELDRHLAIKLIRAGTSSATSRAALAREARSLAKLSHPNVVAIYDVGTHDDELFIAMELVDGVDLATWCTRTRTLAEIRSVFAAAGRGLAAAHGAGLVHRDFKPANVLVGADATIVRVGDFGLARSDRGGVVGRTSDSGRDCESLTATGFVAGTPAYMAPEVHAGIGADARSDQYAFFIALYEALFGVRPFLGDGLEALLRAKRASDVVFPERKPIPGWLRAAIVRGLAVDPQARWPSMDAVVDELERHRSRRWLRDVVLGGVAVGSVALVIASNREPTEPGRCDHVDDLVAAAWGDAQRSQVDRALRAVGGAHGEETATRVGAAID
ncbi:MAG TPA: serine/threonine-protein kinase, partial [Nannocystaceae bacterium]|nr:serine/threonine-protein kinase [Nannocystaceae bacterium]